MLSMSKFHMCVVSYYSLHTAILVTNPNVKWPVATKTFSTSTSRFIGVHERKD